eukprot:m.200772 g.200772  ORF g.200772 m.200772 type:complete len:1204 (-) comp17698_c0_seq1:183-3794(-)
MAPSATAADAAAAPGCNCVRRLHVALFCVALLAAALASSTVQGVSHWVISDGSIVPQTDFTRAPCKGMHDFVNYGYEWDFHRHETRNLQEAFEPELEEEMKPLPDVLSKNRDYADRRSLASLDSLPSTFLPLSTKNIFTVDLQTRPTSSAPQQPFCNAPLDYTLADFQHLPGVAKRANLTCSSESVLETLVLPYDELGVRFSVEEFGTALAARLHHNATSFIYLNLAALYWRIRGNATQSIECLRRALAFSPPQLRDVAMLSLANVLLKCKHAADALVVVQNAVYLNSDSAFVHFTHGQVLAALGQFQEAVSAHQLALSVKPGFVVSQQAIEAIVTHQKLSAVEARRAFEVAVRKASMVLPPDIHWEDFDYEAHEDLCADVECPKSPHIHCDAMDGKCYCDEGFKRHEGKCIVDAKCQQVACKLNGICREGKCFCKPGFLSRDGACEPDPCAKIVCTDGAACNISDGRCACVEPLVQQGAECVSPTCLTANCSRDAVCKDGKCYCKPGYRGTGETCSKVGVCDDSRCPKNSECDPQSGHCRCISGYAARFRQNECLPSDGKSEPSLSPLEEELAIEPASKEIEVAVDNDRPLATLEEDCPAATRRTPAFHEYTSTCLPPWPNVQEVLDLIGPLRTAPEHFLQPFCARPDFPFSARMLDHLPGMAARHDRESMLRYTSEASLADFMMSIFEDAVEVIDIGHMVAQALTKHPREPLLYNLATLFWRVNGNARQALECVRYAVHFSKPSGYDVPLIHAANIFQKSGFVADAAIVARLALTFTVKQQTIAHYTYANALAARGALDQAATHYVQTLRLQPSLDLARQWLRTVQCLQRHKQRKEEEMSSLKSRLNQIQDMLSQQEKHESSHLWDQLKQAEQRLDELVRQQSLPEHINPAALAAAARAAVNVEQLGNMATTEKQLYQTSQAISKPKVIVVEYPKEPSIHSLILAIQDMFQATKDPLQFPGELMVRPANCRNKGMSAAVLSFSNTWVSPLVRGAKWSVDFSAVVPGKEPICKAPKLATHHDNDFLEHLNGVSQRSLLKAMPETNLLEALHDSLGWSGVAPEDVGPTIASALNADPTSWIALNFAALYWRIKGNAVHSIECLQRAFAYGPSDAKDIALLGLANVLHLANRSTDALTVIQMAVQLSPKSMVNHLTLGNILTALGREHYPEAMFFYKVVLRLQPEMARAKELLHEIQCQLTEAG